MLFQIKKRLALYSIPNQRTRLRHFGSYFCIVSYYGRMTDRIIRPEHFFKTRDAPVTVDHRSTVHRSTVHRSTGPPSTGITGPPSTGITGPPVHRPPVHHPPVSPVHRPPVSPVHRSTVHRFHRSSHAAKPPSTKLTSYDVQ